jgi:hypothetical protein
MAVLGSTRLPTPAQNQAKALGNQLRARDLVPPRELISFRQQSPLGADGNRLLRARLF